eukprot:5420280-Pyramimonas_sp.AAC.1
MGSRSRSPSASTFRSAAAAVPLAAPGHRQHGGFVATILRMKGYSIVCIVFYACPFHRLQRPDPRAFPEAGRSSE